MAVPSFVGSDTQDSSGAQSLTFTVPAATTTDDFILVFVKQSENTGQQIWDDDGGGGNGYTRIAYNRTTGGRDQETAVYYKFATSGSEANPTFTWDTGGTNEPMSGAMLVYRGVDTVAPYTEITWQWAQNDGNPPNPDVQIDFANTRVVCCHNATHDDISTVAAPTGFTLRTQVWNGTSNDHRNHFTADIEVDTTGTYSPPDWQHSVLNTTPEYQTYTIALNETQPIHVTGGTGLDQFNWTDTNLTVTGDGFGSSQGTGKVEYWSDTSGTIKTSQSIDTWSDTSIQFDATQGSLPDDTVVYLVVTNDSGDVSGPKSVPVGLLPYYVLISDTLKADHYWRLNNTYDDTGDTGPTRNMTSGIVGTWTFNTTAIADGNTHSLNYSSTTNRREITDSANMNVTIDSAERTLAFWLQLNEIQPQLASIWKEGGGVQNLVFLTGYGNTLLFQGADTPGNAINAQCWSSFRLATGRPYHVCGRYSLTEDPKELRLYIDGVEQPDSDGNPLGTGSFNSHSGDVTWGDPDTNLETGGTDIAYNTAGNAQISDFATWSDNSAGTNAGALDKTTEIRDILFRRGAVPKSTLSSGTQSAMQTALEALDETRADWPLSLRVAPKTGGGNLELTLEDSSGNPWTFEDRITSHVEWRGTDTLTLVRPAGCNLDADKCWSASGGTISVEDRVDLTVTMRDIDDSTVIVGARVRLEAGTGGPETEGTVLLEGVTDGSGEVSGTYRYSSSQPVTGRARKGSSTVFYKTADIVDTIGASGLDITVFMIKDE